MKNILIIFVLLLIAGVGYSAYSNRTATISVTEETNKKIIVYKSPTCGCCTNYVAYLKKEGFEVEVKNEMDMESIKEKYNVPAGIQSCHTAIIDGYFVEGHIPAEGINKLLAEKPNIIGIALPGMPQGSPGMPGAKTEDFTVMQVEESGDYSSYTNL